MLRQGSSVPVWVPAFSRARQCRTVLYVFWFMYCCSACLAVAEGKITDEEIVPIQDVEAVQGGVAKLPCNIDPPLAGDKVYLVIWFKEGVTAPIYSFDAREKTMDQAKHWADESTLGGRAFFRHSDMPAKLTLDSVKNIDSGIYRCRVDFAKSPTRNLKVNLTVLIPPEKLSILNDEGKHIPDYILGPYNEGSSVNITCVATGGRPTPRVTWWQENALVDDEFEILPGRRVRNVLYLEKLQRKHLHAVYTCQASNNNLISPISSSVTLDINLRPLWVKLIGENRPLSAETKYELTCEVVGARPDPTITWWKGSIPMKDTRETRSPDRNTTYSVLTFVPTVDDGGKYMSCRGAISEISDSGIEDGWKLDIYHVPIVSLELGSNLNGSVIKEGVDVYFECNIKSNPWVYKVSWRHNGKMLYNNAAAGTIVSNQSLVLQSVTRARAGLYTCVGSNQEGDGESNPVQLDVKFAPVCRPGQPRVFGVGRQETGRIPCEVEANPPEVQFLWKFNNTAEAIDITQSQISADRTRSVASYTPMTELDYGTLLCWAKNEIGAQKEPCVYFINPAGKPDPLQNCTILNQTEESLHIDCEEGFDGGLPQEFIMEVYDSQSRKLVSNMTSNSPIFSVAGLESGMEFDVGLYAANKKGRSDVVRMQSFTLKSAEKHTASTPVLLQITPLLGALFGVVVALVVVAIIIVIVIRLRGSTGDDDKDYDEAGLSSSGRRCASVSGDKASTEPLNKDLNDSVDSLDEKNPDIIPQNNADDDYQDEERAFERLNNSSVRYTQLQVPNNMERAGGGSPYNTFNPVKGADGLIYAELSLPKQHQANPHLLYGQQTIPMSMIRRPDPIVYAQIDPTKRVPNCLQPLSPPHPSALPSLHHQHMTAYHHLHDGTISAETPLLTPRESPALQPLIEATNSRTSTLSSQQPRVVSATRF